MAKKSNTGLYIGIGVGILAIGGLVFFLIKRKKKKDMLANLPVPEVDMGSSSSSSNQNFPLKKGSRGNKVKNLQAYLNSTTGNYNLVVDGIYGNKTADALKKWNGKTEVSSGFYDWLKTQPTSKY